MELRELRSADMAAIREVLASEGWTEDQIAGQLEAIQALTTSDTEFASVADDEGLVRFVSAEF